MNVAFCKHCNGWYGCWIITVFLLLLQYSWWMSTLGTPQWSHGGSGPVGWETAAGVPEKSRGFWVPRATFWGASANQGQPCKDSSRSEFRINVKWCLTKFILWQLNTDTVTQIHTQMSSKQLGNKTTEWNQTWILICLYCIFWSERQEYNQ